MVNYHFHSLCSFDSEAPLTELCAAAVKAGITELCLTDHCDLVDEHGNPDDSWDWTNIDGQLALAREKYPRLNLRRGIELGQAISRPEAAEKVLAEPNIDFVLGSMHVNPGGRDYYWIHYETKAQCHQLMEEYLLCLLQLSKTDYYDSLAHLTYPLRYMRRDGMAVDFRPFDDLVREILKVLVHRGKALELNTSGYRTNNGEPLPPEYILRMYRELGGDLITVGTDAHVPQHMNDGLERGLELLRHCGFRYLSLYENRKPRQMPL